MADASNGRKRITVSTIVAIVAVCISVLLGGATIWQTSHYYSDQSGRSERQLIIDKLDSIKEQVNVLAVGVARVEQRVEDHLANGDGAHK